MTQFSRAHAPSEVWRPAGLALWAAAGLGLAVALRTGGGGGALVPVPAVLFVLAAVATLARSVAARESRADRDRLADICAAGVVAGLGVAGLLWGLRGVAVLLPEGADPADPMAALAGLLGVLALWGLTDRRLTGAIAIVALAAILMPGTAAALGSGALGASAALAALLRLGLGPVPASAHPPDLRLADRLGLASMAHLAALAGLLVLILAVLALFRAVPDLDIWASAPFYDPVEGFGLNETRRMRDLRDIYESVIHWTPLLAFLMLVGALRMPSRIPAQIWGFVFFAFLIGPGLIANILFKNNWGRARPSEIEAFGGTAQFTGPFTISDQCDRNCSFISGEGSGIAMAVFVFLALFWPVLRAPRWKPVLLMALVALPGIAFRVVKGRHFLSDTIFAVLIMAVVALVLYRWFDVRRHRGALSWSAFADDIVALADYLWPGRHTGPSAGADLGRAARAVLDAAGRVVQQARQLVRRGAPASAGGVQ